MRCETESAEHPTLCPNTLLPLAHYQEIEMLEVVGQGAYGVVRRGRWKNLDVAVKFVNATFDLDYTNQVRFLQNVQHPNIIRYFATTVAPKPGVIMEISEDGSLYQLIRDTKAKYTTAEAIDWMLQCAKGIAYLHSFQPKPILHRDIKSPNLLLSNQRKQLKIADFGSSSIFKKNSGRDPNVSTPAWTAPEVFKAPTKSTNERYDTKCDVYSWATSFWEVLAREIPFETLASVQYRIIWAICTGARPSTVDLKCRECVKRIITLCWDENPNVRPPMKDIVRILSNIVTDIDHQTYITRISKKMTKRLFVFMHSKAPSISSSSGLSNAIKSLPANEIISQDNEEVWFTLTDNFFRAINRPNYYTRQPGSAARSYVKKASQLNAQGKTLARKGHYPEAARAVVAAIKLTNKLHGGQHPNLGNLLYNLALILKQQGNLPAAETTLKKAVEIYEKNWDLRHIYGHEIINAMKALAEVYYGMKLTNEADTWLQTLQGFAKQQFGETSAEVIDILASMANAFLSTNQLEDAEQCLKKILKMYEKHLIQDTEQMIAHLFSLENVYVKRGKFAKAMDLLERAIKIAIPAYGKFHEDLARIHYNLGHLYAENGMRYEAIEQYVTALKIYQLHHKESATPMKVSVTHLALAHLYAETGKYSTAMDHYKTVLEMLTKILGSNHPNVIKVLTQLAALHKNQGNAEEAGKYIRKAVKICSEHIVPDNDNEDLLGFVSTLCELSSLYSDIGNAKEAAILVQKAIEISKKHNINTVIPRNGFYRTISNDTARLPMNAAKLTQGDHQSIMVAATFNGLGVLYSDNNNYTEAEPALRKALGITGHTLGKCHQDVANVLFNLATLSRKQKKYRNAEALYLQAIRIYDTMQADTSTKDIVLKAAHVIHALGTMYAELDKYEPAMEFFERSLGLRIKWNGKHSPELVDILYDLAHLNSSHKNTTRALKYFQDIIAIHITGHKITSIEKVTESLEYLANTYIELCKTDDAAEIVQHLLKMESPNRNPHLMAKLHYKLARLQEHELQFQLARQNYELALAIFEAKEPNEENDKINASNTALRLAIVMSAIGKYKKAESLFNKSLELKIQVYGEHHSAVADVWKYLANLHRTNGNMADMKSCLDAAIRIEKYPFPDYATTNFTVTLSLK